MTRDHEPGGVEHGTGKRGRTVRPSALVIEPRMVVALETGTAGIVTEVRTDGIVVVAVRGGCAVERGPGRRLEILAGPRDPHPQRRCILDDWLRRPADWPQSWDDTTGAMTRAMWATARAFMAEHGLTLGRDVHVDIRVSRPPVCVPQALKLSRDELLVPFEPS